MLLYVPVMNGVPSLTPDPESDSFPGIDFHLHRIERDRQRKANKCLVFSSKHGWCQNAATLSNDITCLCDMHLDIAYAEALPSDAVTPYRACSNIDCEECGVGRVSTSDPVWDWFFRGMDEATANTARRSMRDLDDWSEDEDLELKLPRFSRRGEQRKRFARPEYGPEDEGQTSTQSSSPLKPSAPAKVEPEINECIGGFESVSAALDHVRLHPDKHNHGLSLWSLQRCCTVNRVFEQVLISAHYDVWKKAKDAAGPQVGSPG